jgi:hypothetical protein
MNPAYPAQASRTIDSGKPQAIKMDTVDKIARNIKIILFSMTKYLIIRRLKTTFGNI